MTLILTTHYMDEAEQLCDRLVVMDKAKIVAEGSPRELIERVRHARRCWSCASTGGVQRPLDGTAGRPRRPDREAARPAAAVHRLTATPPRSRSTTAACGPRACWSGAARSRTSSSGSPAGRLDRMTPHRRRTARGPRPRAHLLVYRRTWRGSLFTTFLAPVLFLLAMGVGLGHVRRTERDRPHSTACLPGVPGARVCWSRTAMQTAAGESMYPVLAGGHVAAHLPRDDRHAAPVARRGRRAGAVAVVPADSCAARSSIVMVAFGATDLPTAIAIVPVARPDGAGVRDADPGVLRDAAARTTSSRSSTASSSCRCSSSAASSSRSRSSRRSCSRSPIATPLWHGVVAGAQHRARTDRPAAGRCSTWPCWRLHRRRLRRLALVTFRRRLEQ